MVGIGASGSDGLRDIREFLSALPPLSNAVVMVVLHRPPDRPSHLPSVLAAQSRTPVHIARQGERLVPGVCYLGEPGEHLTLLDGRARLVPDSAYRNRTIDLLFRTMAETAGPRSIGVVLSGSLDDGARGLKAIHEAGGLVMTLQPDYRSLGSMPASARLLNEPMDFMGDPIRIATEVARRVQALGPASQPAANQWRRRGA